MAMTCDHDATELLKFKTLVLKVPIHCGACSKKVKKVVQSIEGVLKTEVDPVQHKVVVTGCIDAETVIKQLFKKGKQAEIWPKSNIIATTTCIDDKSDTSQEENKPESSSGKSKKIEEKKHQNPLCNETHKIVPAQKPAQDLNSSAKHGGNKNPSPQTNPADKMLLDNKLPANTVHLVKPTEKIFENVRVVDGGGDGGGNSSSEAKKKLEKKVERGEGRINNATPPLMMAEHFPPPTNNVVAVSNNLIQPSIPTPEYREVITYNASSHSSSIGDSAFYAPPSLQHYYAYSDPPANGYYLPPPPDPIRPAFTDHNDYYYDDDDQIGCSIM